MNINGRTGYSAKVWWVVGIMLLSGLILTVTHVGELERFVQLVRHAEPVWLLLAVFLQAATYVSTAGVWYLTLQRAGVTYSLLSLVPVSVAKLFSDQAIPSGGASGMAFLAAALNRRGVPAHLCTGVLLVNLVAYYGAYLLFAVISILLLWFYHAIQIWIVTVAAVFSVVAIAIPAGVLLLRGAGKTELPGLLRQVPGLNRLSGLIADAPMEILRSPALVGFSVALNGTVFLLDAATLWVMLQVVGVHTSFWTVLPSFVLASMVATVGVIPLGLGTFEATCVGMLKVLGVSLEAALTATLLLRGFTLWLPMLPGMWLARRSLR